MNITGFFRQDKSRMIYCLKNLPVKKPHIHSYVTEHFLTCTSNTWLTGTSPGSSCTRCHRSRSGCDSLLQNEHAQPRVLAEGREEPGRQKHTVPAWAAQPGRLSWDTRLQAIQFPKNLLQIGVILATAILIEMGMKRSRHISGFRSKYRNCIFLLVMPLVFSQP